MNALFLRDHGQPRYAMLQGVLKAPNPPAARQILLRAFAAGVSQCDLDSMETPFDQKSTPPVPGRELAGEVLSVGEGVQSFSPGDRVAAITDSAGWAEQVLVEEARAVRLPDTVSFAEGSVLLGAVILAVDAIKAAGLQTAERIVVVGATTTIGSVLVQVAKTLTKASVVAAVTGAANEGIAKKLGPDLVVNRDASNVQDALEGAKVRVAFDTIGVAHRLGHVVLRAGRIVQVGEIRAADSRAAKRHAQQLESLCRRTAILASTVKLDPKAESVAVAAKLIAEGVRAAYGPLFGTKEYVRALEEAGKGASSGKVVMLLEKWSEESNVA